MVYVEQGDADATRVRGWEAPQQSIIQLNYYTLWLNVKNLILALAVCTMSLRAAKPWPMRAFHGRA